MVAGAAVQGLDTAAEKAADEAAVNPERPYVGCAVGVFARADVTEARQEGGTNEVVVAENRGADGQGAGDAAKLAAIEQLAVRQMDVGDGKRSEVNDLADPAKHGAGLEVNDAGPRDGSRTPICKAVDAAGLEDAFVAAAKDGGKVVEALGGLLHEEEMRAFVVDEVHDVVERGTDEAEQVPADDLEVTAHRCMVPPLKPGGRRWRRTCPGSDTDVAWARRVICVRSYTVEWVWPWHPTQERHDRTDHASPT